MIIRGSSLLKLIDRTAGIPLLVALSAMPKRRMPETVRRIGILRTAAMGDTLLLAGVLRDICSSVPGAEVTLITGTDNAAAGALIAPAAVGHLVISVRRPAAAIAALRRCRFDLLIDTGSWPRLDAIFTALSGAAFRVGFRTAGQYRHFAYDGVINHSAEQHEIDNFRNLVAAVGVHSRSAPLLSRSSLPAARDLPPKPYAVFHPWAGGYRAILKQWPSDRWADLADRLRGSVASVVVTGSAAQSAATDALVAMLVARGVIAIAHTGETLEAVAALLCESAVVVSVNTGIMHLSAQLGVPTVALDGPTPPARWGPIGPRATSVTSTFPGCGFLHLGFEYHDHRADCMAGIGVEAVESAVRRLMNPSPAMQPTGANA